MATRTILAGLLILGCGTEDSGSPDGGSSATSDAATVTCSVRAADPQWLESMQDSDLRRLTGVEATPGGATLTERSTAGNRNATRAYLQTRFAELGYEARFDDYGTGINVFAELPATSPTVNTIVLGAHFDTVPGSPGANDNATGVAMVLAAARHARELDCRSQNLLFVLFDEEELGLIGSDYFAQLLANPSFESTITAVHTIDQNGWDNDGDRAFELERADLDLAAWYTSARTIAGATMPILETMTGATDHVSFRTHGFSAIGVTEEYVNGDTTPHYHLSSDTYETVNRDYLASTTRVFLTMLTEQLSAGLTTARRELPRPTLVQRYRRASQSFRQRPATRPRGCRQQRTL